MRDDAAFDRWLTALGDRHTRDLSRPEFLKAVRALSVRYVEARAKLGQRSPIDSAGKRAAFAAFFAPLHFLAVRAVVEAVGAAEAGIGDLLDLGCGTGAAAAAWALAAQTPPSIAGVDRDPWSVREALWTWRTLGLDGRARRQDLVTAATEHARGGARRKRDRGLGIVLGWSVNELDDTARAGLRDALVSLAEAGAAILIVEPLARAAAPWWDDWTHAFAACRPRVDLWKFEDSVPARLAETREAAGFRRDTLDARSLWVHATGDSPPRS